MKKIIRRKKNSNSTSNVHISCETKNIVAKVLYTPVEDTLCSLYTLNLFFKDTEETLCFDLGEFHMAKSREMLESIIIGDSFVKVIPKKRSSTVYNIHEEDLKEYVFYF